MYFKIWIYDIQDITPMEGNPIYNEAIDKLSAWDHINWTHIKIWKNVFGKASSTIFFMFFKFLFHPKKSVTHKLTLSQLAWEVQIQQNLAILVWKVRVHSKCRTQ